MEGAPLSSKETWHVLQACGGRQTVFAAFNLQGHTTGEVAIWKRSGETDRRFMPVYFFGGHCVPAMGTGWTVKAVTRREEWQSKSATDGPWEVRGNAPLVKAGGKIKPDDNWAIHVLPLQGMSRPFAAQKTQVSASFLFSWANVVSSSWTEKLPCRLYPLLSCCSWLHFSEVLN